MSRISGSNTKPEIVVRKFLFSQGYRYRLHDKKLFGTPDIVFKSKKKVIFVHGCFWHGHVGCARAKKPVTNKEFWDKKISSNVSRDSISVSRLIESGWNVLVVWQCELKNIETLKIRLLDFMNDNK